mmetsp:Transcript_7920/g.23853  ORF Transcript_7920/g.23853 Transcript_7920/m.23853 type:complete len:247 (-) Transcript_7920:1260-2000(-)
MCIRPVLLLETKLLLALDIAFAEGVVRRSGSIAGVTALGRALSDWTRSSVGSLAALCDGPDGLRSSDEPAAYASCAGLASGSLFRDTSSLVPRAAESLAFFSTGVSTVASCSAAHSILIGLCRFRNTFSFPPSSALAFSAHCRRWNLTNPKPVFPCGSLTPSISPNGRNSRRRMSSVVEEEMPPMNRVELRGSLGERVSRARFPEPLDLPPPVSGRDVAAPPPYPPTAAGATGPDAGSPYPPGPRL